MDKLKNKLIEAIRNVGYAEGIVCIEDRKHELGFKAKYVDDYLIATVLADMLQEGKIKLIFDADICDDRMNYFLKLLKER